MSLTYLPVAPISRDRVSISLSSDNVSDVHTCELLGSEELSERIPYADLPTRSMDELLALLLGDFSTSAVWEQTPRQTPTDKTTHTPTHTPTRTPNQTPNRSPAQLANRFPGLQTSPRSPQRSMGQASMPKPSLPAPKTSPPRMSPSKAVRATGPGSMLIGPRRMLTDPRTVLTDPRHILSAPRSIVSAPRNVLAGNSHVRRLYSHYSLMDTVDLLASAPLLPSMRPSSRKPSNHDLSSFNQVPKRFSSFIVDQARSSVRDISDLMGSQATIFSTRPGDPQPESAASPPLARRGAIRARQGGLWYRMRVRMRRVADRMAHGLRAFVVRTKRVRSFRGALRRRRRAARAPVSARGAISAPVANPALGLAPATRVPHLSSAIRKMAGQPVSSSEENVPQRADSVEAKDSAPKTLEPAARPVTPPQVPPTPPPHTAGTLRAYLGEQRQRQQAQALWRQYLANVVAQRIALRQEIAVFHLLAAQLELPPRLAPQYARSHRASVAMTDDTKLAALDKRDFWRRERDAREPTVPEEVPETDLGADLESLGPRTASQSTGLSGKLSDALDASSVVSAGSEIARVFHRRSMLGDMLDYSSDSEASTVGSDVERYSTVRRHEGKAMPRSQGVPVGLSLFG